MHPFSSLCFIDLLRYSCFFPFIWEGGESSSIVYLQMWVVDIHVAMFDAVIHSMKIPHLQMIQLISHRLELLSTKPCPKVTRMLCG
jgi:hypothetical protein